MDWITSEAICGPLCTALLNSDVKFCVAAFNDFDTPFGPSTLLADLLQLVNQNLLRFEPGDFWSYPVFHQPASVCFSASQPPSPLPRGPKEIPWFELLFVLPPDAVFGQLQAQLICAVGVCTLPDSHSPYCSIGIMDAVCVI